MVDYRVTDLPSIEELNEARKWWDVIDFKTFIGESFKGRVKKLLCSTEQEWCEDVFYKRTFVTIEEENTNREFELYIPENEIDFYKQIVAETYNGGDFSLTKNDKFNKNNLLIEEFAKLYTKFIKAEINWILFEKLRVQWIQNSYKWWDEPVLDLNVFTNNTGNNNLEYLISQLDIQFQVYFSNYEKQLLNSTLKHSIGLGTDIDKYFSILELFRERFLKSNEKTV